MDKVLETATLAAGCFWCVEAIFDDLRGVEDVVSGYSGGHTDNPTYQQVCSETTGHAEVVQIRFDPTELSFKDLLRVYFTVHDPTTLNRQVTAFDKFWPAENYHQEYFANNPNQPYCAAVVAPKVAKFRQKFTSRLKR